MVQVQTCFMLVEDNFLIPMILGTALLTFALGLCDTRYLHIEREYSNDLAKIPTKMLQKKQQFFDGKRKF